MSHKCPIKGCKEMVPAKLLMCRQHWRMVPYHLGNAVWDAYRPGQDALNVSAEWLEASRDAITAVEEKLAQRGAPL